METHIIVTTHSALISAGASFEAAALGVAVSARIERRSATLFGLGLRGMILPLGGERAWASLDAKRLAPTGGVSPYAPIPAVGCPIPNTPYAPNVNSTPCQSRGRKSFT